MRYHLRYTISSTTMSYVLGRFMVLRNVTIIEVLTQEACRDENSIFNPTCLPIHLQCPSCLFAGKFRTRSACISSGPHECHVPYLLHSTYTLIACRGLGREGWSDHEHSNDPSRRIDRVIQDIHPSSDPALVFRRSRCISNRISGIGSIRFNGTGPGVPP